jgi:hypothetical protein
MTVLNHLRSGISKTPIFFGVNTSTAGPTRDVIAAFLKRESPPR